MTKTACYGKCPVYKITIQGNGKAIFEGQKNVDKIGKYEKLFSKEEIENLIKKFEEVKFFEFKDEYSAKVTDLPTTYLEFTHKGQTKKIKDYYDAPTELKNLEKMIESIANSSGWNTMKE